VTTRDTINAAAISWRKSSRSNAGNDCVEVARVPAGIAVRDSKNLGQPYLVFSAAAFAGLVAGIKQGEP
jgi:hypothetical protein